MITATVARYIDRSAAGIRGLVRRGTIPHVKREGMAGLKAVAYNDRAGKTQGKHTLWRVHLTTQ